MKKFSILLIAVLMSSLTLFGQKNWQADASHSQVLFTVTHMVFSEVTGWFSDFKASFVQGNEDFSGSTIKATIKTASVTTQAEGRDKHLKSADFFDVEKFPEMTFVSKTFEKTGKDTYKITGDLMMHGITKPITLDAKFKGKMKDPWGKQRIAFKATGSLNRYDYDLKWNKTLEAGGMLVSENVDITLNIELVEENQ